MTCSGPWPNLGIFICVANGSADVQVWCGHEYTVKNLEFAADAEKGNRAVQEKLQWARNQRAANKPTIPSTIGVCPLQFCWNLFTPFPFLWALVLLSIERGPGLSIPPEQSGRFPTALSWSILGEHHGDSPAKRDGGGASIQPLAAWEGSACMLVFTTHGG